VLAALDARMGEVYWAACTLGADAVMQIRGEEGVYPPDEVPLPEGGDWWGAGPGWHAYREALQARTVGLAGVSPGAVCSARDLGEIALVKAAAGRLTPAEGALPVYLRDRVTQQR
jgi:tRNA threonylcarbamoyladenosine biosynthesis protein TsaB